MGIERDPGVAVMAPAWVLDATVCGLMTLGSPQGSMAGLLDLSSILTSQGFRRSFDESDSSKEAEHDHPQNNQSGATASSISSASNCPNERAGALPSCLCLRDAVEVWHADPVFHAAPEGLSFST